jgi:Nuclease-related domain
MGRNLLIFAGGIPMAVLLAVLFVDRWHRKRSGERPPQQEKLLRPPGHSLSLRLADLGDNLSGWMMGAFLASLSSVGIVSFAPSNSKSVQFATALLFALCSAGCTVMAWRTGRNIRFHRLGLLGEQSVAEQLQRLIGDGHLVYHDVPGDGKWNIDHVVVGPAGVFAIETKARIKKPGRGGERDHEAVFDGAAIRFPHYTDSEAPAQAERNARWLANMLTRATGERVKVRAIVALPGWWVTLKADSDMKILSGKQVPSFITKEPTVLSSKAIQQISYQLDQRCRDVEF